MATPCSWCCPLRRPQRGSRGRRGARVPAFRQLLGNVLTANSTLVAQRQNKEVKRISSWAAILFAAPSVIGTVYGMNFAHMPEHDWTLGYPMALGLMLLASVLLYVLSRWRGWL